MSEKIILSGSVSSFEYQTTEVEGELLHCLKLIGPAGFKEREAIYDVLLEINDSPNFYCIQDNQAGFPNDLNIKSIQYFDDLLYKRGIRRFYGAIVTPDSWFKHITNISTINMATAGLEGEVISTKEYSEAETFITSLIPKSGASAVSSLSA